MNRITRTAGRLVCLVMLAGVCLHTVSAFAATKQVKITFPSSLPGTGCAESLANFPVLVTLSTDIEGFSYNDFTFPTTGADLRFTDGANQQLKYEIEKWDSEDTSYVWVQVPTLTAGGNIWAMWGNPAAATAPTYPNMWTESGYALVQHMAVNNGTTVADATSYGNTATIINEYNYTTGIIGNSLNLSRTTDRNNGLELVNEVSIGNNWAISCWFDDLMADNDWRVLACGAGDGHVQLENGFNGRLGSGISGSFYKFEEARLNTDPNWRHIMVVGTVGTPSTSAAYVNGVLLGTGNFLVTKAVQLIGCGAGGWKFAEYLDEVRISTVARSACWVAAEYANQSAPNSFNTFGTVVTVLPTPSFDDLTDSPSVTYGATSIALSGTLSADGSIYPDDGETVSVTINEVTQHATISGGAGAFSVDFPTATIPASGTGYTIAYFYPGNANLQTANHTSTSLTVNKATPTITIEPTASAITYGQALSDSTLDGGAASVAGSFAFTTPSTKPGAGTSDQSVTFTPDVAANYENVVFTVSVTVGRRLALMAEADLQVGTAFPIGTAMVSEEIYPPIKFGITPGYLDGNLFQIGELSGVLTKKMNTTTAEGTAYYVEITVTDAGTGSDLMLVKINVISSASPGTIFQFR